MFLPGKDKKHDMGYFPKHPNKETFLPCKDKKRDMGHFPKHPNKETFLPCKDKKRDMGHFPKQVKILVLKSFTMVRVINQVTTGSP